MARNTTFLMTPGTWVELTNADATGVRAENQGDTVVYLQGTVDSTTPSVTPGAAGECRLRPDDILLPGVTLAELFPNPSGVVRLFGWNAGPGIGIVAVSHADA